MEDLPKDELKTSIKALNINIDPIEYFNAMIHSHPNHTINLITCLNLKSLSSSEGFMRFQKPH